MLGRHALSIATLVALMRRNLLRRAIASLSTRPWHSLPLDRVRTNQAVPLDSVKTIRQIMDSVKKPSLQLIRIWIPCQTMVSSQPTAWKQISSRVQNTCLPKSGRNWKMRRLKIPWWLQVNHHSYRQMPLLGRKLRHWLWRSRKRVKRMQMVEERQAMTCQLSRLTYQGRLWSLEVRKDWSYDIQTRTRVTESL